LSIDKAVTDFPEPLSPTMATSSPFFISTELFFTATVLPDSLLNAIERFRMDSNGGNGRWSLVVGRWSLVVGRWSLKY
jgi:hypothetical protein